MPSIVKLAGFDFGSTTCSAVLATAQLSGVRPGGRRELVAVTPTYRSELEFTPFVGEAIDLEKVERLLDGWLHAGAAQPAELFGGGALITGLCAEKENAARLAALVRGRLGDAVIASADDPSLESFVAFIGSAAALSQAQPDTPILSLDIGGGTTNLALGWGGEVRRTGCLRVGARHLRFHRGSYELCGYSPLGRQLFSHLGIAKQPGSALTPVPLSVLPQTPLSAGVNAAFGAAGPAEDILIVVFLRFGACGLTLVPPADDGIYHDLRPTIAVSAKDAMPIGNLDGTPFFLHPNLKELKALYDAKSAGRNCVRAAPIPPRQNHTPARSAG